AYSFGRGYACHPVENFRGPARIGRMLAHINARDAYIFERMQQRYIVPYLLDPTIRTRKHTQIRAQLPLAAGSHTKRLFYERRTQRPGPRISSEIASTSITNSHLARPDAVPPSGGFSARCPPSCYFGSPESDFHFDEFLRISMVELDRCRAFLWNKAFHCAVGHAFLRMPDWYAEVSSGMQRHPIFADRSRLRPREFRLLHTASRTAPAGFKSAPWATASKSDT
ncbi:hypothetical protein ALC56_09879, partial [Trachymyrmex septentrionalis]